jgi:ABC-type Fe3+/spermidine/putrescine transport system ATPase subunit
MNVFDNVAYPLRQRRPRVPKHEISARVGRVLSLVELVGLERRKPDTLSGGQQQRVALARALVAEPSVLLLDEPFCNLDAKLRRKMQVDVRRLQQELGLTVVHVTHDQEEAKVMSDSVAIMFDGKLEQFGTYQDICQKPASAFVADFMR